MKLKGVRGFVKVEADLRSRHHLIWMGNVKDYLLKVRCVDKTDVRDVQV